MEIMTGIYARLSVEHGNEKDQSIEQQIHLAEQWIRQRNTSSGRKEDHPMGCEENTYRIYDIYADMGYSGTKFERPGFQRMLADAQNGRIQCILCKDASRIGRDYLKTGEYLEKIFPMLGVRVICISDQYGDVQNEWKYEMPGSLAGNLRNLMNEWYARDIGRRVRLVKQHQKAQGEYLGSEPPYGWKIDRRDGKRKLVPDKQLEDILSLMVSLRQKEMSYGQIADILNQKGIQTPQEYRKSGMVYRKCFSEQQEENPRRQDEKTVREKDAPENGGWLQGEVQSASKWDASGVRRIILSHTRGDYYMA